MDLKNTQLQQTFGNLVTIGTSAGTPTTGILENGNGDDITTLNIQNGTARGISLGTDTSGTGSRAFMVLDSDGSDGIGGGSDYLFLVQDGTTVTDLFIPDTSVFTLKDFSGSRLTVLADGKVGIGTTSPENNLHIAGTTSVAMTLQAPTHDSGVASTATMNFKYQSSGGAAIGKIELVERGTNSFNGKFVFGLPVSDSGQSTRDIMTIDFNGDILPAIDSLSDIGSSSNRFVDIHADNGTIQTSDRNQKQDFEQITEAEAKVAQKAKGLLTKYKWIKDVQKYGDDAQYHIGIIAQELIAAFEEEGLNYKKYAMIYESEHLEDSGEITTYYGVRYTELLAFIISTL